MRTAFLACVVAGCLAARLSADVRIVEYVTTNIGGQAVNATRQTYIKGMAMRVETTLPNQQAVTIYDLRDGSSLLLDAARKNAERRALATRYAQVEREYPKDRVTVSLKSTGAKKDIAGASAAEQAFTIRVPMTKDKDELALLVTGSAWMAGGAAGADEYHAFARSAIESRLIVGPMSNNRILLASARAQTELYRALSALVGIPYTIDMTFDIDGHGPLAETVRKVIAGRETAAVTSVRTDPIADTMFLVPAGWKIDRK
jgi:hypothetical protein